jgi:hypothetical protein
MADGLVTGMSRGQNLTQTTLIQYFADRTTCASQGTSLSEPENRRRRIITRWKEWMMECDFYLERCFETGSRPSLSQVQKYMLWEFGLSDHATARILRDLARLGKINVISERVNPLGR